MVSQEGVGDVSRGWVVRLCGGGEWHKRWTRDGEGEGVGRIGTLVIEHTSNHYSELHDKMLLLLLLCPLQLSPFNTRWARPA